MMRTKNPRDFVHRAFLAAVVTLTASPAWAGPEWRAFPSLPDAYRSGTVPLHFAAWNGRDSPGGDGGGGGGDRYGIFGGGNPTGLRGGSSNNRGPGPQSGPGNGGTTSGPGGLRGGGV